jgi:predicted nuclease with RNAse H fold
VFRGYPAYSTALTGCSDIRRLIGHYAPARERYNELLALLREVDNILGDGAARLLPIVTETMREVKEKVGLA